MNDEGLFGFKCSQCQAEIEVTPDLIGETIECPACGQKIVVPQMPASEAVRQDTQEKSPAMIAAEKSRTIRIELGDF